MTPALPAGRDFVYEIQAKWPTEKGTVEQTRNAVFRAGSHVTVEFTPPPQKLGEPRLLPQLEKK